jgi:sucrose phosphorylase
MLRLDAIAYLWKEDGASCLHHPRTHAVVKLLRAIIDYLGLEMLILTETNVPHKENISYFGGSGAGDTGGAEAHMVYNFALPPLVLHAAISGDAGPLRTWAAALPTLNEGNCFLNFLASHDGVGLTPARGLIEDAAFAQTLEEAQKRGALISMKSTPAGPVPYELNCSWADMTAPQNMGPPEAQARAFLATYAVPLALPGLPAVYFHSWTGSRAWKQGPELLGYNRAINREKPAIDLVEKELADPLSFRSLVLRGFEKLMEFRAAEDAFNPGVPCKVLTGEGGIFALYRGREGSGSGVICIQNFSPAEVQFDPATAPLGEISVPGHGLRWIAFDSGGIRRELVI